MYLCSLDAASTIIAIPDSRFPIPDSRFPIPDSRFPIPDSRFPIPYCFIVEQTPYLNVLPISSD
ncbi:MULTISPECIES: hypothetical protein [unclassified Moorena]|uniref:hypothetical protein n=1 Tax=unclassified Moorena TaxID=2683338 RepID=UPI00140038F2|nr:MULTISPECIES: hypothetical protein [unclassified Moorena]NEO16420.1 hypothetical protein [Moorena sp. SIO3E8]NEQ02773.1 hypothetical protein [Moorena sp. SIO3F7]